MTSIPCISIQSGDATYLNQTNQGDSLHRICGKPNYWHWSVYWVQKETNSHLCISSTKLFASIHQSIYFSIAVPATKNPQAFLLKLVLLYLNMPLSLHTLLLYYLTCVYKCCLSPSLSPSSYLSLSLSLSLKSIIVRFHFLFQ